MFKLPENFDLYEVLCNFPGHLYIKDLNGVYLGSNNQYNEFLRNFGFYKLRNSADILGKTDYDFFTHEEADRLLANDKLVMNTHSSLLKEEYVHDQEGRLHTYISSKFPLFNRNNDVVGVVGTSINISEQANRKINIARELDTMHQAQQQKTFMDNILWCLPERFFWYDLEGKMVACNEKQAQLFGLSREQVIGMTQDELSEKLQLTSEQIEQIREHNRILIESRKPLVVEETANVNGEMKTFLSYKHPLIDKNNELIGIYGVSVDISEQKQIEQNLIEERQKAEVASLAKSQFLMNMSHDIRTPFSGIIGNAELLQRQETNPEKKQKLRQIIDSSSSLLSLLNDIIDVVQLEDDSELILEPFNIRQSLKKVLAIIHIEAQQKNLKLTYDVSDDTPMVIISNPKSVERVLINTLSNAVKFTHHGEVSVKLSVVHNNENKQQLIIEVKDTGIGIAEDQLDVIFDQFTRLTPAFQRNYHGSGLGLWIVKQLLNRLHGTINITSEINKGTAVKLEVPYSLADTQETSDSSETRNFEQISVLNRILIVEDDPIARKIAQSFLHEFCQADIDTAKSGQQALELIEQHAYDVIILDVGLPDMDGIEVALCIRNSSGLNKETTIIGLTAHASFKSDYSMMNGVIEKPLTYQKCEQIAQVIANVKSKVSV